MLLYLSITLLIAAVLTTFTTFSTYSFLSFNALTSYIMAPPNPIEKTFSNKPASVSSSKYLMAGLLTTVYGLEELSTDRQNVSVLWLHHPRLGQQESMNGIANTMINEWNGRTRNLQTKNTPGLIAVSLDQRNHGSRMVDPIANADWRSGDEQHAQDMFSAYHGTQLDTSQLITYLPAYIFPRNEHAIVDHMVLGISLGGHSAWHTIVHEPRVSSAVVVIGCPDYTNLMKQRAKLSKRKSWTETSPAGSEFIGSADFPIGLVEAVKRFDPAGLFIGDNVKNGDPTTNYPDPSDEQVEQLRPLMDKTLKGKRILNLAGADDNLVPHAQGKAFMSWLQNAVKTDGWYSGNDVYFEDHIFDGVGHAMSGDMVREATRFLMDSLETAGTKSVLDYKPQPKL
jgi:pimeloyl-ACP methyl ester carboxylesterase